ncbi:MAG: glycosyltransferase, partial [Oscillospiraceae bacterium]|nr:glycosyltransferase [Oscillospiraceae bacterium]
MNEELEKEKISIIVPAYKVEPFIRKCIRSVLNQTHKNIEVILVDDESPDNSGKICDAFAAEDSRIKVIHQKNRGLCGARNAGLDVATGDYIGFVDSDDWVDPDMFEYLLKNLKSYEADISACRYYRVWSNNKIAPRTDGKTYIYNKEEAIAEIVNNYTLRTWFWNKLFKKEF